MSNTAVADPIATYVRGREFKMLVGGAFVDAERGAVSDAIDPSTGSIAAETPEASRGDVSNSMRGQKR